MLARDPEAGRNRGCCEPQSQAVAGTSAPAETGGGGRQPAHRGRSPSGPLRSPAFFLEPLQSFSELCPSALHLPSGRWILSRLQTSQRRAPKDSVVGRPHAYATSDLPAPRRPARKGGSARLRGETEAQRIGPVCSGDMKGGVSLPQRPSTAP